MTINNSAIFEKYPEYLNKRLLLSNVKRDGLFTTLKGVNILVEIDQDGMISVIEITNKFDLIPILNVSLRQLGEQYLKLEDPSIESVLKHLILPEMEVERIFNCVRYKYLTAIYLSDFENPQQYMNVEYNKAFQALAGIEVTQLDSGEKKDNDYFWQVAGFSRKAKELDWGKDIVDLKRVLGIFCQPGLHFNYSTLYKELIAIKPGFHEMLIHPDYFSKMPTGDTLRDNIFRMIRGVGRIDDSDIEELPQDMDTLAYFRYAPCHVTEGPFVLRKGLNDSYFDELRKIDSEEKKMGIDSNFFVFDYFHSKIDSQQKLENILSQTQVFTGWLST